MINFKCLGTGSKGNCYLLKSEKETLILDCGIPIKKIKQSLDYNISNVAGVCVSHFHGDHMLALKDLENIGLRVLTDIVDIGISAVVILVLSRMMIYKISNIKEDN